MCGLSWMGMGDIPPPPRHNGAYSSVMFGGWRKSPILSTVRPCLHAALVGLRISHSQNGRFLPPWPPFSTLKKLVFSGVANKGYFPHPPDMREECVCVQSPILSPAEAKCKPHGLRKPSGQVSRGRGERKSVGLITHRFFQIQVFWEQNAL